ncbi:hypothetical protein V1520DRAFT_371876 [Lipomyces starkeyi]
MCCVICSDPATIRRRQVQCDCLFFRKYYLPCRDIFLAGRTYEILTEDHCNNFVVMLENRCFEVYEGRGQMPAREGDRGDIGAPARRALTLKETFERLRSRSYQLEEGIDATQREKMRISGLDLCRERVSNVLIEESTTYVIVDRERR